MVGTALPLSFACILFPGIGLILRMQLARAFQEMRARMDVVTADVSDDARQEFEQHCTGKTTGAWSTLSLAREGSGYRDERTNAAWQAWIKSDMVTTKQAITGIYQANRRLLTVIDVGLPFVAIFLLIAHLSSMDHHYNKSLVELSRKYTSDYAMLQPELAAVDDCYHDPQLLSAIWHWFEPGWKLKTCYEAASTTPAKAKKLVEFGHEHVALVIKAQEPADLPPPQPKQ